MDQAIKYVNGVLAQITQTPFNLKMKNQEVIHNIDNIMKAFNEKGYITFVTNSDDGYNVYLTKM